MLTDKQIAIIEALLARDKRVEIKEFRKLQVQIEHLRGRNLGQYRANVRLIARKDPDRKN